MIVKSKVVAYQYITSKKTGQEYMKIWVKVPCPANSSCIGDPVESAVLPYQPGVKIDIGKECMVSVDQYGRLHDIQI